MYLVRRWPKRSVDHAHVMATLGIFELQEPVSHFHEAIAAAQRAGRNILLGDDSCTVARQMVATCVGAERHVNKLLLDNCSVLGIAHDAQDADLLSTVRAALSKLPKASGNRPWDSVVLVFAALNHGACGGGCAVGLQPRCRRHVQIRVGGIAPFCSFRGIF